MLMICWAGLGGPAAASDAAAETQQLSYVQMADATPIYECCIAMVASLTPGRSTFR